MLTLSCKRFPMCTIPLMKREMVWIDQPQLRGWGCSQCAWVFNPRDMPSGETFEAMMRNFESRRDKEFAAHVCDKYPPIKNGAKL